ARFFFNYSAAQLYLHLDEEVDEEPFMRQIVTRRLTGEPSAYITGVQEFYGLPFKVNKNTLIPRPETELLVDKIIDLYETQESLIVFDVGTGSGAIAITLAQKLKKAQVRALDISSLALEVAEENAVLNNVSNVNFLVSDLLESISSQKADVIAANLPYVSYGQAQTDGFEPYNALYCGGDPLELIKKLAVQLEYYLKDGGGVFLEVGIGQAQEVLNILHKNLSYVKDSGIEKDLAGIERLVWAQI
ncbi:MAG: peptide chain release factor N(5)-glutamine methyltransferase, partial [Chloroflexi bacterium]|nr:peptide chain release factor N(5)-glutamine methyltransferase [Chloroflexota bacterium]